MSVANMLGSRGREIGETSRSLAEVAGSSGRLTSDNLRKAQDLVRKLPSPETIKLHTQQCELLRTKLIETLYFMQTEERLGTMQTRERLSTRLNQARYSKVFHELRVMAQRIRIFLNACCYDDKDFVLAAIRVSAHKERFVKYHVELDWLIFLVDCIKEAARTHGPVSSSARGRFTFKWKEKVKSLLKDTNKMIETDFNHFNRLLKQHVQKTGDHQRICVTLLRRFGDETVQHHETHGVPLIIDRGRFIGSGAEGGVYEFEWKGTVFAVKEFTHMMQLPSREVAILEKCSHPNIANLILAFKNRSGKQCHMMERLSMDLLEYVKKERHPGERPLEYLKSVDLMLQIGEGMLYLSEERHQAVSHRDLKPGNILVNLNPAGPEVEDQVVELQVADFGRAKVCAELEVDSRNTPNVGTTIYRAPELFGTPGQAEKINKTSLKADVYSFGMTCSFLLTGREPYLDIDTRKHERTVVRHPLPDDCPPELSSLLKRCWSREPDQRPASFSVICEELRNLKAQLLTYSDELAETSDSGRKIDLEEPSDSCDLPLLRILVLGDSKAVNETVNSFCDPDDFGDNLDDHMALKASASPPMRLYYTKKIGNSVKDLSNIKTFVAKRNERWHHQQVKKAWKRDLIKLNMNPTEFPDSHKRLHLVWCVCTRSEEIANWLRWNEITHELCGLPVQLLVTNGSYKEILQNSGWFNFDIKNQTLENLIIQIHLEDAEARNRLWRTCWEVKYRDEIANAAALMAMMRKELGPNGMIVPVNIVTREDRGSSLLTSKETILSFLGYYWEISGNFQEVLVDRAVAEPELRFEVFCLQNAAFILYNKRVHRCRSIDDAAVPSSLQFLREEAAECFATYFENMKPAAYNKKAEQMSAFLLAVFEGKEYSPSQNPLNWRSKVATQASNYIRKLRGNGHKTWRSQHRERGFT